MNKKPSAQHLDEPKGSYLHIRVTQAQKAKWVKRAQARGMKLSAWVLEKLERKTADKLANDLERYNKWRRGAEDIEQPNPTELGILINEVIKELRK